MEKLLIGFCVAIQNIYFPLHKEKIAHQFYLDLRELFNRYKIPTSYITFNGRIE